MNQLFRADIRPPPFPGEFQACQNPGFDLLPGVLGQEDEPVVSESGLKLVQTVLTFSKALKSNIRKPIT